MDLTGKTICKNAKNKAKVIAESQLRKELEDMEEEMSFSQHAIIAATLNFDAIFDKFLNNSQIHVCTTCQKQFLTKNALKFHNSDVYSDNTKRTCKCCHAVMSSVRSLKRHMKRIHKDVFKINIVVQ